MISGVWHRVSEVCCNSYCRNRDSTIIRGTTNASGDHFVRFRVNFWSVQLSSIFSTVKGKGKRIWAMKVAIYRCSRDCSIYPREGHNTTAHTSFTTDSIYVHIEIYVYGEYIRLENQHEIINADHVLTMEQSDWSDSCVYMWHDYLVLFVLSLGCEVRSLQTILDKIIGPCFIAI